MLIQPHSKLLFIGDSVTDMGRSGDHGPGQVSEGLFDPLGKGYPTAVNGILNGFAPGLHIHVINAGIGGNDVRDLKRRWQTDVLDIQPDWLSIMIGINDVWRQFDSPGQPCRWVLPEQYEALLEELVASTLPKVKGLVLMTPYFIEENPHDAMRARMDQYGAIVKAIATRHDTIFVDLQAAFLDALKHQYSGYWAWDRVHPNIPGAFVIAKAFLKAVQFDFSAYC